MKYADEALRQKLAAEYVLGTMPPRTRRRFEAVLHQHPGLRRAVTEWEERLLPLAGALPGVAPPAHVWEAVRARIQGRRPDAPAGVWQSLAFWRLSTITSALVALVLVLVVALPDRQATDEAAGRMVVVMNDLQTRQPAMTATWEPGVKGDCIVRLRVIAHADMAPGTAWEMWMLPGGDEKPVSLGLITTHETQVMVVPAALAARLDRAAGLAMSVEPAGGSPTGLPSGPVLYAGPALKT